MYGLFSELHIRSESVDLAKKLTIEVGTFEQNTYWGSFRRVAILKVAFLA